MLQVDTLMLQVGTAGGDRSVAAGELSSQILSYGLAMSYGWASYELSGELAMSYEVS